MKMRTYQDYYRTYLKALKRGHLYFAELMHAHAHRVAIEALMHSPQPAAKVA